MEASAEKKDRAPRRANELDTTGRTVADNVQRLRKELGLTTADLARRLTEMGRSMQPTTITKIENRQRRVDADDLMALALALGVNVAALLLPRTARGVVEMTGIDHPVSAFRAWSWAAGESPMLPQDDPTCDPQEVERADRDDFGYFSEYWEKRSQHWRWNVTPHHHIDRARDWARHREALNAAADAAQQAVNAGMSVPAVVDWLQETLRQDAVFERADGAERVITTVGSPEYNHMANSDAWRELAGEEKRVVLERIQQRVADGQG